MQFFYRGQHETVGKEDVLLNVSQWIKLLSELLLEIRKSMGNEGTSLNNWEMIEWFMSDFDQIRELNTQYSVSPVVQSSTA